ncbi:hypothetical protein RI367_000094 [Sorochytrium milnesiophthora]
MQPAILRPLRRTYVSASTPASAQNVFSKIKSLRNIFRRQQEQDSRAAAVEDTPAATEAAMTQPNDSRSSSSTSKQPSKAVAESAEAAFRRAKARADKIAAMRLRQAEAAQQRRAELDERPVAEVVREALTLAGLPADDLRQRTLTDVATKAEVLARVGALKQHMIPDPLLARIESGEQVVEYYARVAASTRLSKHPVAAWFADMQAEQRLPPNVVFVPYVKERGLKVEERTQARVGRPRY